MPTSSTMEGWGDRGKQCGKTGANSVGNPGRGVLSRWESFTDSVNICATHRQLPKLPTRENLKWKQKGGARQYAMAEPL